MARTLSAGITAAIAEGKTQRYCHLLDFQVGETNYRFTDGDAMKWNGNVYTPHLRLEGSAILYTQKLRQEPFTVKLQNITLATAKILKAEGADLQGVEATLRRLFLATDNAELTLFFGRIGQVDVDEREATLSLVTELDPVASQVPKRKYSHLHSSDGKTLLEYAATPHLFDGFLHLTRDLTLAVEGQLPDAAEDDRALGVFDIWD